MDIQQIKKLPEKTGICIEHLMEAMSQESVEHVAEETHQQTTLKAQQILSMIFSETCSQCYIDKFSNG